MLFWYTCGMQKVTRKFLVRQIPDLDKFNRIPQDRWYLYIGKGIIIRVQKTGSKYELERKADKSNLLREEVKIEITKPEFESLIKLSSKSINRDIYEISKHPTITLKIYHKRFEKLIRAEVSFNSIEEAKKFVIPDWFGKEITDSPLSKDGTLLVRYPNLTGFKAELEY